MRHYPVESSEAPQEHPAQTCASSGGLFSGSGGTSLGSSDGHGGQHYASPIIVSGTLDLSNNHGTIGGSLALMDV